MIGYKITIEQANCLIGKKMNNNVFYLPIKDVNENYFIFESEKTEAEILLNATFKSSKFVPNTKNIPTN